MVVVKKQSNESKVHDNTKNILRNMGNALSAYLNENINNPLS